MTPSLVRMNRTISHIAAALTYVIKRLQTNRRKANKALSEALGQLEEVDSFNDKRWPMLCLSSQPHHGHCLLFGSSGHSRKTGAINEDYLSMVHLNLANIYDEMGERELSEEHYSFAS